jgi:hypothetical protein
MVQTRSQAEQQLIQGELQNKLQAVATLEQRKAQVDADLEREKRGLPDAGEMSAKATERAGRKRQLELDRAGFKSTGLATLPLLDPKMVALMLGGLNKTLPAISAVDAEATAEESAAKLKQDRVSTLQGMSSKLGTQLEAARKGIPLASSRAQTALAVSQIETETAGINARTVDASADRSEAQAIINSAGGARGASGAASGAAAEMTRSLQETITMLRTVQAENVAYRRQLDQLRGHARATVNR